MKQKLKFWYYYNIIRRRQHFLPWVARRLPKKLKYYVVIEGMAHHTVVVDQHAHPDDVKGWDILKVYS